MKIKWFGHSFFLITTENGKRIAMDPFDERVGYSVPDVSADIITISHNHYDHNQVHVVHGNYECITREGEYHIDGITIKGIPSSHGFLRGKNIIYVFKSDKLSICHCGDLGKILTLEQMAKIGHTDILILPIGGATQVLNTKKAQIIIKQLKPQIIIPMHYKTDASSKMFALSNRVEPFLEITNGKRLGEQELTINSETIKQYKGVLIFDYE